MRIQEFHKYNRLVRRGVASPLTCTCGTEFIVRATEDGEPVLQCLACPSMVQPGLKIYDRIRAINGEFYV